MTRLRHHPLADAAGITVIRFVLMVVTLQVAAAAGVGGWDLGLVVNVVVALFAAALMTRRRLWRSSGFTTAWRSRLAALALLPLLLEAVSWTLHGGMVEQAPGYIPWATTLLLVGVNEELISRGVILTRLREAYRPVWAVLLTAGLFGLQHLSAFALTSRAADDILLNVLLSGTYGFALAAFQLRFAWIWPLIFVHALADFSVILAGAQLPNLLIGISHLLLLAYGIFLLRGVTSVGSAGWIASGRVARKRSMISNSSSE
ncbi:MAG: CPBP family intramembrane metalloprotease [Chloroflexota bacterium]|nr:CPBP family intramembrane metalloprotease [Chloroflexota bacterium]